MYFRNVLMIINIEEEKHKLLNIVPDWKYSDDIEVAKHLDFCLVNEKENIIVSFEKIKDNIFRSINVLPYHTDGTKITEPQEKDIHNDILFDLCLDVKERYKNYEVLCGIIPCIEDRL